MWTSPWAERFFEGIGKVAAGFINQSKPPKDQALQGKQY
jgi:hypothetical protein